MLYEQEFVSWILATGILLFMLYRRYDYKSMPKPYLVFSSFVLFYSGWTLTMLEGFLLPDTLNFIEHSCYMLGSLTLAVWCWDIAEKHREPR